MTRKLCQAIRTYTKQTADMDGEQLEVLGGLMYLYKEDSTTVIGIEPKAEDKT